MFGKSKEIRPDRIDTVIGKETKCTGTIEVSGALRVEGQVEGTICGEGDITIGEAARVNASIQGRNITIAGRIKGNIQARGRLELLSTAHMEGDIAVANLMIAAGAHFDGKSTMQAEVAKEGEERDSSEKPSSEPKPKGVPPSAETKGKKSK